MAADYFHAVAMNTWRIAIDVDCTQLFDFWTATRRVRVGSADQR